MTGTVYYILGVSKVLMGRLKNSTYSVFNRQTGVWFESSYAFDQIVMGYARVIPESEVKARIQTLFPDEGVAVMPPRRSTVEHWRPFDVAGMVETWQKEARQEIATERGM